MVDGDDEDWGWTMMIKFMVVLLVLKLGGIDEE